MFNSIKLDYEKKSVFFINSFLILYMIIIFLFEFTLKSFFYVNIIITLIISYIFFKKSRKLSKMLILTNMFILFYFMYPFIAEFLYELFRDESYIFILFYNILIAYIFLLFSGFHKSFLRNVFKVKLKLIGVTCLIGVIFGLLFFYVKEPIPDELLFEGVGAVLFFTFILALSEQIIFSGFLFNVYSSLTVKKESYFEVATIFVLFHLLRLENLVIVYFKNFNYSYLYLIAGYYVLLFLFMLTALYLYDFKGSKYKGNFVYPVLLHFVTDTILILLITFRGY